MITKSVCPFTGDKSLKIKKTFGSLIITLDYSKVLGYTMMVYDNDERDSVLIIEDAFISDNGIGGRVVRDLISDEKRKILSENMDDLKEMLRELERNINKI